VVDTGLEYTPGDAVQVDVVRREHRVSVSDGGGAVRRAGTARGWRDGAPRGWRDRAPRQWRDAVDRVGSEIDVNISRDGVISLPVVGVGPGEEAIVRRIAEASLALYQELLELRSG
jgi:hypothetical protein